MLSLAVVWGAPGESAGSDRSDKRMAKAHVAQGMEIGRAHV